MTKTTLVGASEIEDLFGVNRMQLHRLLRAGDFPEPAATLRTGRVWHEAQVAKAVERLRASGRINEFGHVIPRRFLAQSKPFK
jgi:hypothetical protein